MPESLPYYFTHLHYARQLHATDDRQLLIQTMLNTLNSPKFHMLENLAEFRVVLHFLPKAGLPLEGLAAAMGTDIHTLKCWINGSNEPTWLAMKFAVGWSIDHLAALQPHPPEGL